jgi:hypothetical protein
MGGHARRRQHFKQRTMAVTVIWRFGVVVLDSALAHAALVDASVARAAVDGPRAGGCDSVCLYPCVRPTERRGELPCASARAAPALTSRAALVSCDVYSAKWSAPRLHCMFAVLGLRERRFSR